MDYRTKRSSQQAEAAAAAAVDQSIDWAEHSDTTMKMKWMMKKKPNRYAGEELQ